MTLQDTINANAAQPQTPSTVDRMAMLANAGYTWMDPEAQGAYAQSQMSDQQMMTAAGQYHSMFQTLTSAPETALNTLGKFFDDPVLQKQPSAGLALQTYLLQRQGWAPIEEADLRKIQNTLAKGGYLDSSEVNGVWTPQSQQAFLQATSDHVQQQIHEGGGFSISGALSAFLPSHVIPALVGAVKSIPDDIRHIAADAWAETTVGLRDFFTGKLGSKQYERDYFGAQAQAVNALGGRTTPQEALRNNLQNQLNAINGILTFIPVARAATVSATAAREAALKGGAAAAAKLAADQSVHDAAGTNFVRGLFTDLGPAAAQRGPGIISRSLYSVGENGSTLGLMGSRFFAQNPVLRFMVPPVRTAIGTTDNPGLYYAFRTLLAQPNRLPIVQAAGTAVQQAELAGAQERLIAAAESKIGGRHTAFDDQIYSQHTIGGTLGLILDMASGAFHGPLETPFTRAAAQAGNHVLIGVNPSQTVGDMVQGWHDASEATLRPVNAAWAFNRGTAAMGNPMSVEELVADHGEPFATAWFNTKLNQFAAAHYADANIPPGATTEQRATLFRQLSHDAWHDPAKLDGARAQLVSDLPALAARFAQDANSISRDQRDEYRRGLAGLAQVWPHATALFGDHAHELVTPLVHQAVADARQERQFAQTMGDNVGAEPGTYTAWMRENRTDHEPGSFGVARRALPGEPAEMETQTERQMNTTAAQLQARYDKAGRASLTPEQIDAGATFDPQVEQAVRKDAIRHLAVYAGIDPREMEGMTTQALIDRIRDVAKTAPKDVDLPLDPSPALRAKYQAVLDAGFKPVIGTDIGHLFAPPVIDPLMIEGYNSKLRALAEHMGLSTLPVSVKAAGMMRSALTERTLQNAIDKGVIRVPPSITGARLHTYLLDNLADRTELRGLEGMAFKATRPLHMTVAKQMAGEGASAERVTEEMRRIETQIARGTQPLEVAPKRIVEALTRPMGEILGTLAGNEASVPFMDAASARKVADLYNTAAAKEPAWMFGAGKLEDVFRGGFGFLGTKASTSLPVVRTLTRLPANLIRFRNRYRFQLDPMFSMRRVVKSAAKGSVEGAPLTVRPFSHMVKAGTLDHDLGVLNRVYPMPNAQGFDAMDRMLYEQDAFGLYNPRHHMALLAGELARQGVADGDIRAKLERAFTYGDRTALERTVGTFFYPFSFEKTLWRNVGSYVMDHPGQRLLLGSALSAYHALSQHDHIDQWLQDHAPALKEFQKLNAFDHGIGPGEVGGVNAMYAPALWNMLAPQKFGAMKEPQLNLLASVLPLYRELNSMLIGENFYNGTRHGGSLLQQGKIGWWGLSSALDDAMNTIGVHPETWTIADRTPFGRHPELTYQAEQTQAYAYRNNLIMKLAPVLDFNYHHRGSEMTWNQADFLPAQIRGQKITRATIDEIVHQRFPDFDPTAAQTLAVANKSQEERYLGELVNTDPQRGQAYRTWYDTAKKVIPLMQRAEDNPALYGNLATLTGLFREWAINMAEQDPQFLAYYNRFYVSRFGPIEQVTS